MLATRGCLPFRRVEGNTQSPGWGYVVFSFQTSMNSASNGWSGTGPFDALLFGKPTWPHVQVRRTWIIPSAKLTSSHCKAKHSDIRRPVPAAKSVRVRSGSRRLHTIAYACSGVRIIASYPLVVLQRTKRMGFDSWFRGIRPYLWPCLYTKDMTRRVLSSVIGKMSFLFQGPQPLLQFQRFDAQCDSVPPSWEHAVSENSLVAFYGCVRLGAD